VLKFKCKISAPKG